MDRGKDIFFWAVADSLGTNEWSIEGHCNDVGVKVSFFPSRILALGRMLSANVVELNRSHSFLTFSQMFVFVLYSYTQI